MTDARADFEAATKERVATDEAQHNPVLDNLLWLRDPAGRRYHSARNCDICARTA